MGLLECERCEGDLQHWESDICANCGRELYLKITADLRKLVKEMAEVEEVNKPSLYPALSEEECMARTRGREAAFWKGKIDKLLGGE